jgi:hypothetical protein
MAVRHDCFCQFSKMHGDLRWYIKSSLAGSQVTTDIAFLGQVTTGLDTTGVATVNECNCDIYVNNVQHRIPRCSPNRCK